MKLRVLLRDPRGWIATGFASGLSPLAPGTVGTLMSLPLWFVLGHILPLWAYLGVLAMLFALGCWCAQWVIAELAYEDPGCIVIDEWVGMGITWLVVAFGPKAHAEWIYLLPAFLIFRVMDIAKVWPANWADRHLHGGFGAMLDDTLAGIWGAMAMALLLYWLPW
jgi:phosphatidylglycerophosphatase A